MTLENERFIEIFYIISYYHIKKIYIIFYIPVRKIGTNKLSNLVLFGTIYMLIIPLVLLQELN